MQDLLGGGQILERWMEDEESHIINIQRDTVFHLSSSQSLEKHLLVSPSNIVVQHIHNEDEEHGRQQATLP